MGIHAVTDMPHLIAGDKVTDDLRRITEAYLRNQALPLVGRRLTAPLCNAAVDWWNARQLRGGA